MRACDASTVPGTPPSDGKDPDEQKQELLRRYRNGSSTEAAELVESGIPLTINGPATGSRNSG